MKLKGKINKRRVQHEIELFSNILFSANNIIDLNNKVEQNERQFYCHGCKNSGQQNFVYRNHIPGGQQFVCDECHSTIVVAINQ